MKRTLLAALAALTASTGTTIVSAHEFTDRPDGHAPIGVMGDHTHETGEWMVSYRFRSMLMDGNRDGTSEISTEEVLADYMVAPLDMQMSMHMFGVMHAPSDQLTLMAMLPYMSVEMDHETRNGTKFTTEGDGIGDVKIGGLYKIADNGNSSVHLNAGVSLPTGDIDITDDTPAGRNRLPYPMQIGSGTYDLLPGITYSGYADWGSWGAQADATVRLGENDNDYTLGNKYGGTAWVAKTLGSKVSTSLRLRYETTEDIDGADPTLNARMIPTADPELRGGERLDAAVGINVLVGSGHRFAIEYQIPVEQDLDGPQLETQQALTAGWQYTW